MGTIRRFFLGVLRVRMRKYGTSVDYIKAYSVLNVFHEFKFGYDFSEYNILFHAIVQL